MRGVGGIQCNGFAPLSVDNGAQHVVVDVFAVVASVGHGLVGRDAALGEPHLQIAILDGLVGLYVHLHGQLARFCLVGIVQGHIYGGGYLQSLHGSGRPRGVFQKCFARSAPSAAAVNETLGPGTHAPKRLVGFAFGEG